MPVPTSTLSKPEGDSAGSSAVNTPAAAAGLSSPPSNINSNIWLAAGEGDLDSVRYLLDNQPDLTPTSPDDFSYTAVHAAASYAQLEVLDFLLSHPKAALYKPSAENSAAPSGVPAPTGAANVQDSDGDTPLFVCETVEPAKLLIEKFGADPKHRNLDGKTAAQAAYENEAFEVCDYLRSLTGEPEPTDDDYGDGGYERKDDDDDEEDDDDDSEEEEDDDDEAEEGGPAKTDKVEAATGAAPGQHQDTTSGPAS
ncbi:unnamed protein product [Tilletia controversa]|nr:unnamed protein product [Tilletia controversa]CAD6918380.1 unnamed protein product [Tilletia controversa]